MLGGGRPRVARLQAEALLSSGSHRYGSNVGAALLYVDQCAAGCDGCLLPLKSWRRMSVAAKTQTGLPTVCILDSMGIKS